MVFPLTAITAIMLQQGNQDVIGTDMLHNLAEVAANKAPPSIPTHLLRDLILVAEDHHLRLALHLSQEFVEEDSIFEVADDHGSDEGECLAVVGDAGVALEGNAIGGQFFLYL